MGTYKSTSLDQVLNLSKYPDYYKNSSGWTTTQTLIYHANSVKLYATANINVITGGTSSTAVSTLLYGGLITVNEVPTIWQDGKWEPDVANTTQLIYCSSTKTTTKTCSTRATNNTVGYGIENKPMYTPSDRPILICVHVSGGSEDGNKKYTNTMWMNMEKRTYDQNDNLIDTESYGGLNCWWNPNAEKDYGINLANFKAGTWTEGDNTCLATLVLALTADKSEGASISYDLDTFLFNKDQTSGAIVLYPPGNDNYRYEYDLEINTLHTPTE